MVVAIVWTLVLFLPVLVVIMAMLISNRRSPLSKLSSVVTRNCEHFLTCRSIFAAGSLALFYLLAIATVTEANSVSEDHVGDNEGDGQHGGDQLTTLTA